MKTKYLPFLLLAWFIFPLLSVAKSTTYRSYFGNEFTHWYTFNEYYDVAFSYMYLVEGDTILSKGISYKKLYDTYQGTISNYRLGIREDTETGSLFINKDGDLEILISRMDLEIGDKFYFSPVMNGLDNFYYFDNMQTDEKGSYTIVDSIYYDDNRKYIRFETTYHAFTHHIRLTFIEGIGPNVSLDPFFYTFHIAVCFNCHETENELCKINFLGPDNDIFLEECLFNRFGVYKIDIDFLLKLIQRKGEIELQPNAGEFESGKVCVYSIQGELLYTKPVQGNKNIIIPTSGFSNGTFIVLFINDKNKQLWSRKVII